MSILPFPRQPIRMKLDASSELHFRYAHPWEAPEGLWEWFLRVFFGARPRFRPPRVRHNQVLDV